MRCLGISLPLSPPAAVLRTPLIALAALAGLASAAAATAPEFGILQFRTQHNLSEPDCLAAGNCFLAFEEFDDPGAWLAYSRNYTNLAALHWDQPVPWFVFDEDPPPAAERVAFYDGRLDAPTVAWLDAFATHFQAVGRGYLAVSVLAGERNALAPLHLGLGTQLAFEGTCQDLSPGATPVIDRGSGPESFDLERSYRNFVLYLAAKLQPDYLALLVEANLLGKTCPTRSAGLYALYRNLYDAVRAELGPGVPLFATLVYPELLAYDQGACYPTLDFTLCTQAPAPPVPNAGAERCYPIDRSAIDALELGGRLDILALSFYPDGLQMNPLADASLETTAFTLADWNASGACTSRQTWPNAVDPFAALDRLNWTGPVAIAETSARSCTTPMRFDIPAAGGGAQELVLELAGTPAAQARWIADSWQWAEQRNFEFVLHSFVRDYAIVGPWTVEQMVLSKELQQLFNIWPCSGFEDLNGNLKPEMALLAVPEPTPGLSGLAGALALLALYGVRAPR